MILTYRSPESSLDHRYDYDNAALKLALEKTKKKWGDYRLVPSPKMNFSRAISMLKAEELINPMFKHSASNALCGDLGYAPFPVDLGIVSYRVFFVSKLVDRKLHTVTSLENLRGFSIGQGYGWLDVGILSNAGFNVIVIPSYESLFTMVARGRFDLLSRGVNEVKGEFEAHQFLPNFVLHRHVGLYYPLPRFFFTNKTSNKAAQRVYEGLVAAYEDGSLMELWERKYRPSLDFTGFREITFFHIENPYLNLIDSGYKRFFIHDQQEASPASPQPGAPFNPDPATLP